MQPSRGYASESHLPVEFVDAPSQDVWEVDEEGDTPYDEENEGNGPAVEDSMIVIPVADPHVTVEGNGSDAPQGTRATEEEREKEQKKWG